VHSCTHYTCMWIEHARMDTHEYTVIHVHHTHTNMAEGAEAILNLLAFIFPHINVLIIAEGSLHIIAHN